MCVRAEPMFEGLLVLNTGFAQVTAVWVGDTRPSALLRGAGESRHLVVLHHTLLPGVTGILGTASLDGRQRIQHLLGGWLSSPTPHRSFQTAVSLSSHRIDQCGTGW